MKENTTKSILSSIASDLTSITKDVAEAAFDSITKDEFLKNIPLLNTLHSVVKAGIDVRERLFINKVLKFLFELKDIPVNKRENFMLQLQDSGQQAKAGENIIAILDKLDDSDKATFIGKLFRACITGKFEITVFLRLSYIVNNAFLEDLLILKNSFRADGYVATYHLSEHNADRLYRIGLASAKIIPDSVSTHMRARLGETNKPVDYTTEYKLNNDALIITRELFGYAWIENIYNIYTR